MTGQVMRPIRCIASGSAARGYPGNAAHAMWSIVIARMAISFIAFEFSPFLCSIFRLTCDISA